MQADNEAFPLWFGLAAQVIGLLAERWQTIGVLMMTPAGSTAVCDAGKQS
jgi:hypothetical protein